MEHRHQDAGAGVPLHGGEGLCPGSGPVLLLPPAKTADALCSSGEIAETAFDLFKRNYHWDKPIRSVGVRGAGLVEMDACLQLSLFQDERQRDKRERIDAAVDSCGSGMAT